jgi:hypothetical protein
MFHYQHSRSGTACCPRILTTCFTRATPELSRVSRNCTSARSRTISVSSFAALLLAVQGSTFGWVQAYTMCCRAAHTCTPLASCQDIHHCFQCCHWPYARSYAYMLTATLIRACPVLGSKTLHGAVLTSRVLASMQPQGYIIAMLATQHHHPFTSKYRLHTLRVKSRL